MPPVSNTQRDFIRTTGGMLNGVQLTCILLSGSSRNQPTAGGRNALQFHRHVYPRKVTLTEAGSTVIETRVDSLEDLVSIDTNWFVPSAEMKAKGAATGESGAVKINLPIKHLNLRMNSNSVVQPVIVFGLLTPSGHIVEAHSPQPSDPNSAEAVKAAQSLHMPVQTPTHERAFHKCLNDLQKIRSQKIKGQIGFESERRNDDRHASFFRARGASF